MDRIDNCNAKLGKKAPWLRPEVRRINAGDATTGIELGPEVTLLLS